MPCDKIKYKFMYSAMKHLQWIRRKSKSDKKPIRPYLCPACGFYHLTSKEPIAK